MGYFKELPNIQVINRTKNDVSIDETVIIKNFFKRAKIREDIIDIVTAFEYYQVTENETPSQVAENIYGEPELDWVILTTNNIINVQDEWPIGGNSFNNYLLDKYGSEEKLLEIHHYETIELLDSFGRVVLPEGLLVDETFYNAPEFKDFTTAPPGINFPPIFVPGTQASAVAVVENRRVVGVATTNLQSGLGYKTPPTVTFSDPPTTISASVNASITGFAVTSFNTLTGGKGYLSTPTITIQPPPNSIQSVATCEIDTINGEVLSINLINGGSGYGVTAPTITFPPSPSITEGSYINQSSISIGNQVDGMFLRENGLDLFTSSISDSGSATGTERIKQYSMSTAWDVTTVSFVRELNVSADFSYCTGIEFRPDGTQMFVVGGVGSSYKLISYNLSTPWNISTATKLHQRFVPSPGGIRISPDGSTLFFLFASSSGELNQYDLGTAWNITTYADILIPQKQLKLQLLTEETINLGFSFSSDGLKLFATGQSNSRIYEISLTSAYDLDGATLINGFYVGSQLDNPSDVFLKPDNTKFVVSGGSSDKLFEYLTVSLARATATLTNGSVTNINLDSPGVGYTVAPTITLSAPFPAVQATATAIMVNDPAPSTGSFISSINLTNGGFGYLFNPTVSITPAPNYRTAVGFATLNSTTGISNITIVDGGTNYTTPPTITIGVPDEIQTTFPNDLHFQNNQYWRWNGTKWQEKFTEEFKYFDGSTSSVISTAGNVISRPVTNYEYETILNEKKRTILILKPRYLSLVITDLKNIMRYDPESSTYIDDKLKSTYNPKFTLE